MELIKANIGQLVYYKSDKDSLSFIVSIGSCVINSYNKKTDFFYELNVISHKLDKSIISVYDSDGNKIDEFIVKAVVALPEEQFNYID